MNVRLYFEN